jgi:WD40 repeat protein
VDSSHLLTPDESSGSKVAFSPDGKTLVTPSRDGHARLWRFAFSPRPPERPRERRGTDNKHSIPEKHNGRITDIAFSPNGQVLASGSADKAVRLRRATDGNLLYTIKGHTDRVMSVAFSPDGLTLAAGLNDGTVWLWWIADLIPQNRLRVGNPGDM